MDTNCRKCRYYLWGDRMSHGELIKRNAAYCQIFNKYIDDTTKKCTMFALRSLVDEKSLEKREVDNPFTR